MSIQPAIKNVGVSGDVSFCPDRAFLIQQELFLECSFLLMSAIAAIAQ